VLVMNWSLFCTEKCTHSTLYWCWSSFSVAKVCESVWIFNHPNCQQRLVQKGCLTHSQLTDQQSDQTKSYTNSNLFIYCKGPQWPIPIQFFCNLDEQGGHQLHFIKFIPNRSIVLTGDNWKFGQGPTMSIFIVILWNSFWRCRNVLALWGCNFFSPNFFS
jgi:hypothetical protein